MGCLFENRGDGMERELVSSRRRGILVLVLVNYWQNLEKNHYEERVDGLPGNLRGGKVDGLPGNLRGGKVDGLPDSP